MGFRDCELIWPSQLSTDRIRLTTEAKKVLDDDDKPISDYGVSKGATLLAKDLGFQICASAMRLRCR